MRREIEGVHEDTGRKVSINFDLPAVVPSEKFILLIDTLDQASVFTCSDSFRQLAEHFPVQDELHGPRQLQGKKCILGFGRAMARFMGNPRFRERLSISGKNVLHFDHLAAQYDAKQLISFQLMHRSQLDPKLSPEDHVFFVEMHGQPYFIGDFNKTKPSGEMDLAATVMLRDLVWADSEFLFAGPPYYWHDQYLSEIRCCKEARNATLERLLYRQPVPALGVSYGEVVSYHAGGYRAVEILAASDVSRASNTARIAGKDRLIVREGMGVVFEPPIWITCKGDFLERIYGVVVAFKDDAGEDSRYPVNIQIRVHLARENIPPWLLSRLKGSDLLQTNLQITISEAYLVGVFSIWPPCLYQGTCVPCLSDEHVNDRIVVGHLQILRRGKADEEGSSGFVYSSDSESGSQDVRDEKANVVNHESSDSDASSVISPARMLGCGRDDTPLQPFIKMFAGEAYIDVYRVKPMTGNVAFSYLGRQQELTQSDRPHVHIRPLLHAFEQFCKERTSKKIKTMQSQRTFHPPIPGRVMMALLRMLPEKNIQRIDLSNMTMVAILEEPSFLDSMFSRKMSEFDFRSEGFGVVRLLGPIYFKWELCLSEDGCGPTEGRLSVTVGGWTEMDRSGMEVIKQSSEVRGARAAKRQNPCQAIDQVSKTEKRTQQEAVPAA